MKVAIFNDTTPTFHHGCNLVMHNLVQGLKKHNVEPVLFWPVGADWRPQEKRLLSLDYDAIIVNGEGSIHRSRNRARARFLPLLSGLAKKKNVPAFLLNSTVHDLDEETLEHVSRFSSVYVRESKSFQYLKDHQIDSTVVPDLTLARWPGRRNDSVPCGPYVTDSVLKEASDGLEQFALSRKFRFERMEVKLSYLTKKREKIRKSISRFWLRSKLRETSDFEGFVDNIARSQYVVTGRFHTVTLCLLTGTPFWAIESNTPKITSIVEDAFGSADRVICVRRLMAPDADNIENAISFSETERAELSKFQTSAASKIDKMFSNISKAIGSLESSHSSPSAANFTDS